MYDENLYDARCRGMDMKNRNDENNDLIEHYLLIGNEYFSSPKFILALSN